ncbi:PhoH family protein [Hyphomicrobium sp. CS1GBMeth3]|uniref:PhoH family protein n=1 Tax=Hyphomicrobium sp. CS1GBMeth3 TaxID=1892845 RepID=UPI0009F98B66|nr:PhoH family protein [Hyphomicrobium sp. CS1GBMeth3]
MRGQTAVGRRRVPKSPIPSKRVVVPFEDNRHLTRLLGEFDANLALIEDRLGIEAHAHGNVVILSGSESACEIAREVLEKLYERVTKGEHVGPGDFDGLIRHARQQDTPSSDGQAQIATRRRVVKARTPAQSTYIRALDKTDLVFGIGPAGTGKTYLAVAYAAQCLERGVVERIILSRPAVEAGERLGFLPGDMREKVDPYLRPLYDALYDVLPPEKVERDLESGVIEIAPLAFMRGRTLANAFVILDEAQNTTSMQMKMFLTRLGENSKMVVTGDPSQVDLPPGMTSGLEEAVRVLSDVDDITAVRFSNADVVRRDLVAKIVAAYDTLGTGRP